MTHRSRLCHFVIDVNDLDQAVTFWTAALDAKEEQLGEASRHVYRRLRLPDSNVRIPLQHTNDPKAGKERMHLDLETDDVEAEVRRLEALGGLAERALIHAEPVPTPAAGWQSSAGRAPVESGD